MILNVFGTAVKIKEIHTKKDGMKAQAMRMRTPIDFSPKLEPLHLNKSTSMQPEIKGYVKKTSSNDGF